MKSKPRRGVVLAGGLGNQLFQLAACVHMWDDVKLEILYGIYPFRRNNEGKPDLFSFKLPIEYELVPTLKINYFSRKLMNLFLRFSTTNNFLTEYARKNARFIGKNSRISKFICGWEHFILPNPNNFSLDESTRKIKAEEILAIGYFQSGDWLENSKVVSLLQEIISVSESNSVKRFRELAKNEMPLVVHIRLSDYKNSSKFGLIAKSYYQAAIQSQLNLGKCRKIWLFSDDIIEARKYISSEWSGLVREFPASIFSTVETFEIMREGKAFVISNSSFSWWSAFLSREKNARIIAPNPWFRSKSLPTGIYPKNWDLFPSDFELRVKI